MFYSNLGFDIDKSKIESLCHEISVLYGVNFDSSHLHATQNSKDVFFKINRRIHFLRNFYEEFPNCEDLDSYLKLNMDFDKFDERVIKHDSSVK